MRPGDLRHRFQLLRRQTSTDAEGRPQETWTPIGTVRGMKRALTVQERLLAAQQGVVATHEISTWARAEFATPSAHDLRLVEGSRTLDLVAQPFDPDDKGQEVRLQVREILPG